MSRQPTTDDRRTDSEPAFAAVVEAPALRTALDAVAAVVDECVIQVTPEGLAVDAQDPATVALVSLEVPASAFEAYEAGETTLGVDLERFRDVVGMADRDELVRLGVDDESRTLHVRVGELSYALGLLDPDTVRSPPESTDFSDALAATVVLDGGTIVDAVSAADMVSDHLAIGIEEGETLYAAAEGDTDSVRVERGADDCEAFDPAPAHSLFSVSYLDAVASVVPGDAAVTLQLGEEAPLKLAFDLADGSVRYVVAPRISRS